ncbi:MAG: response regulator [Chloroflexi bacterium]|uniref:response regulator n=1 Tax=Candidatus Flexifilum breve TaxID=3140694 RepID=UPI003135180D|nr:response regulator [Chloroflexota bacterium]MBK9745370.1 response regulator [Chloroflexota bacterium]
MNPQISVLYVEDDPHSRTLMRMLLSGRMKLPNVTIFENSEDFLAKVEALTPKPDVIFLDIHMQPYDGFTMLSMLQQLDWAHNTRIVALTASVMNEEVVKLRQSGFDGCLAKPIDLTTFPDTFQRIVDGEAIWRIIS